MFGAFCAEHGIRQILTGVRIPTTCGKIERWHRSFREEVLHFVGDDVRLLAWCMPGSLAFYNAERPHWTLDLRTPMEVYLADFIIREDLA